MIAGGRGASASAAELAEAALRLTPPGDVGGRHRRALSAARAHRAAGEWPRVRTIARELLEDDGRLTGYRYLYATKADLLNRLGQRADAAKAYREALAVTANEQERDFLTRRLSEVSG